jgi:hypothetical protein
MNLTPEQRTALKENVKLSIRTMTNTKTYQESDQEIRSILLDAANEIGQTNFKYAHPELVLTDAEINQLEK